MSRFGFAPPTDSALLEAFLGGAPFRLTGPSHWNALGLGSTALFAVTLAYTTEREGMFEIDGRRFMLRRDPFQSPPSPEWFAVDLLNHAEEAGCSRRALARALLRAVDRGRFDANILARLVAEYGTAETQAALRTLRVRSSRE